MVAVDKLLLGEHLQLAGSEIVRTLDITKKKITNRFDTKYILDQINQGTIKRTAPIGGSMANGFRGNRPGS